MPQLIPYYFVNQLTITFIVLFLIIFLISQYILPNFPLQYVTRLYLTKL